MTFEKLATIKLNVLIRSKFSFLYEINIRKYNDIVKIKDEKKVFFFDRNPMCL